jgi:chemotaxis protein MotB
MARSRRALRQNPDIWPGFVDALSTLLLVIIFLLVVFVLGQFFLNQLLQGKDSKLASLEQAIAGLTEQLNMEEATTAELRLSVAQLTSDLQAAQADRDDTASLLAETEAERDDFRQRLFALQDEKALLSCATRRRGAVSWRPSSSAPPTSGPSSRKSCGERSRPSPPTRRPSMSSWPS